MQYRESRSAHYGKKMKYWNAEEDGQLVTAVLNEVGMTQDEAKGKGNLGLTSATSLKWEAVATALGTGRTGGGVMQRWNAIHLGGYRRTSGPPGGVARGGGRGGGRGRGRGRAGQRGGAMSPQRRDLPAPYESFMASWEGVLRAQRTRQGQGKAAGSSSADPEQIQQQQEAVGSSLREAVRSLASCLCL